MPLSAVVPHGRGFGGALRTRSDTRLFEERKRVLVNLLRRQRDGISFNEIGFPV